MNNSYKPLDRSSCGSLLASRQHPGQCGAPFGQTGSLRTWSSLLLQRLDHLLQPRTKMRLTMSIDYRERFFQQLNGLRYITGPRVCLF